MSTQETRKRECSLSDDDNNYTDKIRRYTLKEEDSEAVEDSNDKEEENNDDAEEEDDNHNDDQVDDRNDHDSKTLKKMLEDKKGIKKWLGDCISWDIKKARDKKLNEPDNLDNLDLYYLIRICRSRSWTHEFREDLETYPNYKHETDEQNSQRTGRRCSRNTKPECGNCQACIRPWSVKVTLDGEPYDKKAYRVRSSVVYYIGSACHKRSELYHKIYHFRHKLTDKCNEMMKSMGAEEIEKVLSDQMFNKLESLTRQALKYAR